MTAICKYCNKPVILTPSANERARRYGGVPADYTALFPNHSECEVAARSAQAVETMRKAAAR
jgi:hypothetical protein